MKVAIVDYGMGNLKSIYNALLSLGTEPVIVRDSSSFDDFSHLVIPGVGAFKHAMDNLVSRGLDAQVKQFAGSGRPVLGICLGMQLLASTGSEPKVCDGLDLITAEVVPFSNITERVPHIGWNAIEIVNESYILEGVKEGVDFYFVHSYYCSKVSPDNIIATTNYGIDFPSIIAKDNVVGVQFHPEKSQKNGLKILSNFIFH